MPRPTPPVRRQGLPAPAVRGTFKARPEDFVVEEVLPYEPSGEGSHLWLHVEKRAVGTLPLIDRLARALGVSPRAIGHAGLKDAFAVTRQWLSVEGVDASALTGVELEGVRFLAVTRHRNRLKIGHLRQNRFRIVLRGTDAAAFDHLAANLEWLGRHGAANWVGEQRFGHAGRNLEKGLALLRGERLTTRTSKPLRRLLVSAVQSEVFNRVLARRIPGGIGEVLRGDVAWLHKNGACFLVEEPVNERVRCARFEISPSGPLPGPKLLAAQGEPGRIEADVLREMGLTLDTFATGRGNEGARRPLRVPLDAAGIARVPDGVELTFTLPRGSFATAVLRELLADVPWPGEPAPEG